jgi:NAD(P)H dehydrogenase (quinone)
MTTAPAGPVAVLGATGAQGAPVVEALLAAAVPVRALARTPSRLAALQARGVDVRPVDLADADALADALDGVWGVFAHLPFVPVPALIETWSQALVQALTAARVPITVFTLSGPAPDRPVGVPSLDTKAQAKRILSRAPVAVVGLEPTGYLGNLSAPFSAPSVVHAGELRYPLPADHRQPWISVEDQAALAVAALGRPDLAGSWLRIGQQLTGPELAEGIGRARGRSVRYVPLDPDEFGRVLAGVMGPELGAAVAADYRALGSRADELGLDADTGKAHAELGVAPTEVADWARTQDWEAAAAVAGAP